MVEVGSLPFAFTPTTAPRRLRIAAGLMYVAWASAFLIRNVPIIDGHPVFLLFDDGMISMRYAANLVAGQGLVWNPGEYVEGYTNPLWTMVMAGAIAVAGAHLAPLIIQGLGLALSLVACAVGAQAAVELLPQISKDSPPARSDRVAAITYGLAFFLIATAYPITYFSLTGMEVSVIACLAAFAALISIRAFNSAIAPSNALVLLIWIGVLLYFTRPDAPLNISLLLIATAYLGWRTDRAATLKAGVLSAILAVAVIGLHLAWRYNYYGALLPNTYVLKVDGYTLLMRLRNGAAFLAKFAFFYAAVLVLQGILLVRVRKSVLPVALVGSLAVAILYQLEVGGDPWPYWRQLGPALAVFYIALAAAMVNVLIPRDRWQNVALVAGGALFICVSSNFPFLAQMALQQPAYQSEVVAKWARVGLALRQLLKPDAVVMPFWAGVLPYVWQGPALDPLGKTDRYVASLPPHLTPAWGGMKGVPGHSKFDLRYSIVQKQPDYIEYPEWGAEQLLGEIAGLYVMAEFDGLDMCLLKNSPRVRWEKLDIVGPCKKGS